MGFISFVKGLIDRLFAVKDIKTALGIDVSLTQPMVDKIDLWQTMYAGSAPWLNEDVQSLRLEQSITREFVNVVLNEMTVSATNERLDKLMDTALRELSLNLQQGLATGAMIIKPLGDDKVQYVSQNGFVPVEYDVRGRLTKVIFPEFKQLGEQYYTRLEYHSVGEDGLTIENKAYISSQQGVLGREIPLETVDEWSRLPAYIRYPKMLRPAFGYYVNPIKNTIDGSHVGVSVFDCAADMIRKTDVQFGRLDWEFESGERAIHVDESALKGNRLARLNKRLYRGLDLDGGTSGELFKEFSPALRQNDLVAGLDEYKRQIEFAVGLAYGDISNPQAVEKTATEVNSAKQRKYNTVTAIQKNLKDCLEDLCYALAFFNGLTSSENTLNVNFEDSVLTDEETKRACDRQDVAMGAMPLWEYRMKWYGEDEKTAKSMVAGSEADVVE